MVEPLKLSPVYEFLKVSLLKNLLIYYSISDHVIEKDSGIQYHIIYELIYKTQKRNKAKAGSGNKKLWEVHNCL